MRHRVAAFAAALLLYGSSALGQNKAADELTNHDREFLQKLERAIERARRSTRRARIVVPVRAFAPWALGHICTSWSAEAAMIARYDPADVNQAAKRELEAPKHLWHMRIGNETDTLTFRIPAEKFTLGGLAHCADPRRAVLIGTIDDPYPLILRLSER